jgi:hypothetical protein
MGIYLLSSSIFPIFFAEESFSSLSTLEDIISFRYIFYKVVFMSSVSSFIIFTQETIIVQATFTME